MFKCPVISSSFTSVCGDKEKKPIEHREQIKSILSIEGKQVEFVVQIFVIQLFVGQSNWPII